MECVTPLTPQEEIPPFFGELANKEGSGVPVGGERWSTRRKAERRESAETQECVPHISKEEKMDVDELVPGAAQGVETRRFVSNPVVGGSLSRYRPEPAFGHPKHMSMLCSSMELQIVCLAKPELRSGLSFRRPLPRWRSTRSAAAFPLPLCLPMGRQGERLICWRSQAGQRMEQSQHGQQSEEWCLLVVFQGQFHVRRQPG